MASDKKDRDKKKGFVPPDASKPDVRVEDRGTKKPTWCNFPGPGGVKVPLRVAMTKDAYADITSHAAGSVDAEICGVLAGTQCEDDDGPFLKVSAAVRGEAARKGSTHVTFTHETWDVIHKAMEKDHPKLDIVGWYHSHPGFGVEFSEMDIFIQKNFFKAETQVAFVVDPLGRAERHVRRHERWDQIHRPLLGGWPRAEVPGAEPGEGFGEVGSG